MNTLFATEKERDSPRKPFIQTAPETQPNLSSHANSDANLNSGLDPDDSLGEDLDPRDDKDREVTLNSATLLGIFFGLVLVCALCFGLGFTLGKRSSDSASRNPSEATNQAESDSLLSTQNHPKPPASSQNLAPSQPTPENSQSIDSQSNESTADDSTTPRNQTSDGASQKGALKTTESPTPAAAPNPAATRPAKASQATTTPSRPAPAIAPSPTPGTIAPGTLMVQIAAVSKSTDAEVLVAALTRRGYSVAIHHEPTDSLLHVQVGPFSNRDDAIAMRQKLLSDGYNAILK